jgi:hypothetical protein
MRDPMLLQPICQFQQFCPNCTEAPHFLASISILIEPDRTAINALLVNIQPGATFV